MTLGLNPPRYLRDGLHAQKPPFSCAGPGSGRLGFRCRCRRDLGVRHGASAARWLGLTGPRLFSGPGTVFRTPERAWSPPGPFSPATSPGRPPR